MNAERHIRKLNALLAAELGNPPYRWIYSESAEFKRPMRAMNEDGELEWNYRCPCGLNVRVHSPECVAGMLVVVEAVWEARKTDPELVNQWVLCCLQEPMPEDEWMRVFGSVLPYPSNGSWAPVGTETRTIAMEAGVLPGENFTMAIIRGRQRSRAIPDCDIANAAASRDQKREADRRQHIRERIHDVLPVNPDPGKRGGSLSWGGTEELSPTLRRKIEQGESLVTV